MQSLVLNSIHKAQRVGVGECTISAATDTPLASHRQQRVQIDGWLATCPCYIQRVVFLSLRHASQSAACRIQFVAMVTCGRHPLQPAAGVKFIHLFLLLTRLFQRRNESQMQSQNLHIGQRVTRFVLSRRPLIESDITQQTLSVRPSIHFVRATVKELYTVRQNMHPFLFIITLSNLSIF